MKLEFIFMAAVSAFVGMIITFLLVAACLYFGIDMSENLWVIVIPITLAILVNIFLIEFYNRRYKKK